MEIDISFKLPDNREFTQKILNSLTMAEVISVVNTKTDHPEIILKCMGTPLPPGKTLEELDARSGFVFGIEPQKAKKITLDASNVSLKEVLDIFSIGVSRELLTIPRVDYPVPEEVWTILRGRQISALEEGIEPYSRWICDFHILGALSQARKKPGKSYQPPITIHSTMGKKRKICQDTARKELRALCGYELQTEITDPETNTIYVFTGRPEWAAGHIEQGSFDPVFVGVRAKWSEMFAIAEAQLTAQLAICRHKMIIADALVVDVQGFASDGVRFVFQILNSEGLLYQSKVYDTRDKDDFKIVYNFMVHQFEAIIHLSSPNTPSEG